MRSLTRVMCGSLAALMLCVAMCGADGRSTVRADGKERKRAAQAARDGEFEAAEKLYRQLVAANPRDVAAHLGLSFACLKQRNLREAYDQAMFVLTIEPRSSRAYALIGMALLVSGDFKQSDIAFRFALTIKDDEALAIAGLSMINFYENRSAIALAGLRRAVQLDSKEPDYIFYFAQAAARNERYREAADAYETFLRVAPQADEDRRARIRGLIAFLRYLGAQRQLYQTEGASRASLPFELVNRRPIINVRLNGSKTPFRFVVDTGSGMCVLSTEAAARIGIKPVAHGGLARAVGGEGRFEIVYGFLTSLQMGEARIASVPVYIRHFHNTQESVDGYIGLSVLAKYIASIDYGAKQMTLQRAVEQRNVAFNRVVPLNASMVADNNTPSSSLVALTATPHATPSATPHTTPNAPPSTILNALPNAAPQVEVSRSYELPIRSSSSGFWSSVVLLEGIDRPLNFIVDTGASISVISRQLAGTEDMTRFEQKVRLKIYGAAGVSEDVMMLMLPRVGLGSYTHPNFTAAVMDMSAINETAGFEQAGIIGGNILRHFRVTFDFQRGIVRLDPLANDPAPAASPATRDEHMTPASGALQ